MADLETEHIVNHQKPSRALESHALESGPRIKKPVRQLPKLSQIRER